MVSAGTTAARADEQRPDGRASRSGAPTILLLYPTGWGNLGDAAILESAIQGVRRRQPGARVIAVTLNPADTEHRHGVEAFYLAGRSVSGYGIVPRPGDEQRIRRGTELRGTYRLSRLPLMRRPVRFLNDALLTLLSEPAHGRRAARLVEQCDMIVVAGGGQLDEFWGGPWGHPYALYKWGRLAERAGVPFVFLSVGVCDMDTWLSRSLLRAALGRASYHSLRDRQSMRELGVLGVRGVLRLVPDLAYGLPLPASYRRVGAPPDSLRIAVSPIAFRDPRAWPVQDADFYGGYVRTMAGYVEGLREHGWQVSLFATDGADWPVIEDVRALLGDEARNAVAVADTHDLGPLLEHVGSVERVVASGLHGVLLSQIAGRPTLALSYDAKVDTLMRETDVSQFALPITTTTTADLLAMTEKMAPRLPLVQMELEQRVQENRAKVEAQYDELFGSIHSGRET